MSAREDALAEKLVDILKRLARLEALADETLEFEPREDGSYYAPVAGIYRLPWTGTGSVK